MGAPLVVAVILICLGTGAILPIVLALWVLGKEASLVSSWPHLQLNSAIGRTLQRVKMLVQKGTPVDPPELADLAVEESLPKALPFTRYMAQAAVYIGLFGALMGLQQSIGNLGDLSMSSVQDIESFVSRIRAVLADFSGAFWSAIAGILVTVILNLLLSVVDRRTQSVAFELEDKIRNRLLTDAGVDQRIDPAFEAMRNSALQLGQLVANAQPALEATINQMKQTSDGLLALIHAATVSLSAVRQEFVEATAGLSTTLKEGALAIESSADRVGASLAGSAIQAGEAIAASADHGAEAIRTELQTANLAHSSLLKSTEEMQGTFEAITRQLAKMEETLHASESVHAAIRNTQDELRNLAAVHKQFAQGVRADISDANAPLLAKLSDDADTLSAINVELAAAMRSHRDFLTKLEINIAQLPDSINQAKLQGVVESSFHPVQQTLNQQASNIDTLKAELNSLIAEVRAISNLSGQEQHGLLNRLAALDQKLDDPGIRSELASLSQELSYLRHDLGKVKERVNSSAIHRLLGRKV